MSYRFLSEKIVKTRKPHVCCFCKTSIQAGAQAHTHTATEEHITAYTLHSHLECWKHAGQVLTIYDLDDLSERSFGHEEALHAEASHD